MKVVNYVLELARRWSAINVRPSFSELTKMSGSSIPRITMTAAATILATTRVGKLAPQRRTASNFVS